MMRLLRPALVIARRDFTATVLTPTFLIFLLAPLLMLSFGAIGGFGAAQFSDRTRAQERLIALAAPAEAEALRRADARLRPLFGPETAPPGLEIRAPAADPERQARALLAEDGETTAAILYGPLARPAILRRDDGGRVADYAAALAAAAAGSSRPAAVDTVTLRDGAGTSARARSAAGFGAVFAMFFLTLLLAGQAVGMLAEERGNKVIEILAAAVPLEAVFLGKLIGMLGVALLFIAFWGALAAQALALVGGGDLPAFAPAVGLPGFALLFIAYFLFAFLLFGAVFLGVGAQAGSMREIQMLSLPITIFQVAMFGLATAAAGAEGSAIATIAAVFPFSSPFAMAARAATGGPWWQHAAALAWQAAWLALTITIAARLFRRGVLKSGGIRRRRR